MVDKKIKFPFNRKMLIVSVKALYKLLEETNPNIAYTVCDDFVLNNIKESKSLSAYSLIRLHNLLKDKLHNLGVQL